MLSCEFGPKLLADHHLKIKSCHDLGLHAKLHHFSLQPPPTRKFLDQPLHMVPVILDNVPFCWLLGGGSSLVTLSCSLSVKVWQSDQQVHLCLLKEHNMEDIRALESHARVVCPT